MRDLVVREALKDLAEEASDRFRELVRAGEEVPYEVREPGPGAPLATYAPLTGRFISERTSVIAGLDSFGPAKVALCSAGVTGPYLDALGLEAVPQEGRRAEDTIVAFLCRVWEDRSDFAFEPARVDEAIAELEACAEADEDEVEVVVPLIGLRMTTTRVELASATIVRGDTVEAPPEANAPEGTGRAGWEPQFLAVARCRVDELDDAGEGEEGASVDGSPLAERFHAAVTALRLFKSGGIGLGPHAWVRVAGRRWRRIATGSASPRGGAYHLADSELGNLAALARALEKRPPGRTHLGRAITRFEAGLAREAPLDALNDHLLALRFLLEGDGPAKIDMPVRVAALCAPPSGRDRVQDAVERALALERELWSGEPASGRDDRSPVEIAGEIEDFARAILRDAACGHLGNDLRATADEILLADGLAAGEGASSQRGETSEWEAGIEVDHDLDPPTPAHPEPRGNAPRTVEVEIVDEPIEAELAERASQPEPAADDPPQPRPQRPRDGWVPFVVPEPDEELEESLLRSAEPAAEYSSPDRSETSELDALEETGEESQPGRERDRVMEAARAHDDWLAESGRGETLDFPRRERGPAMRLLDQRPEERKAIRERVSNLFPAPETTDWSVGELGKSHERRNA